MAGQSTAGTTLHITSAKPSTFNVAGYNTLFTTAPIPAKVGEIGDIGEFGREWSVETFNAIDTRGTQKFKTTFDEGKFSLQLLLNDDDAGQNLLSTANNSDNTYSVMVKRQDGGRYFMQVLVTRFKIMPGGASSLLMAGVDMEITTNSSGVGIVED